MRTSGAWHREAYGARVVHRDIKRANVKVKNLAVPEGVGV